MAAVPSSSALPPASDSEREELLDRMLTRLALTEDSKLHLILPRILPFSISSLSSPSPSIRKLVMEILTHVNKRVKHHTEIELPFSDLWKTYKEAAGSPMVRNFCIIYIEMAFDRLPLEEKVNVAPELLNGFSMLPTQHQDIILRVVSKVIGECHSKDIDLGIGAMYQKLGSGRDGELFIEFCLCTILYQVQPNSFGVPPGLSVFQFNRVTGKIPMKNDVLTMKKLGILNVIEAMQLEPELVYPLYIAASLDSQEHVAKKGEELLKRKTGTVNLENPALIQRLFLLFNGTAASENVAVDSKVSPVNVTLRNRLMSVFCHSIAAANAFPSTLQCIFSCIYGRESTSRLKQLGMEFTVWVFKHAIMDQLKLMAPAILAAVLRSLDTSVTLEADLSSRGIKSFSYEAIKLLAFRMPHLFREKVDIALRLFDALKLEDQSLRLSIQETLACLAIAYKGASSAVLNDLERILLENCQVEQNEVRLCALRWATSLFGLQHCPSRYMCMLGASDTVLDIREVALEGLYLSKSQDRTPAITLDLDYPKLSEMLDYISQRHPILLQPAKLREGNLPFASKTYIAMIQFLMKCFEVDNVLAVSVVGQETCSTVETLCLLLEHAMSLEGSVELHGIAAKSLVEIASRVPQFMALRYAHNTSWLKLLLGDIDSDTRESVSRLLGIAGSQLSTSEISTLLSELVSSISGSQMPRFEHYHGFLCSIGYVTNAYMRKASNFLGTLLESIIERLVHVVETESAILASVAMDALGHIGVSSALPSLLRDSQTVGVLSILRHRLDKLLLGNEVKSIQKIIISLGHISMNETSSSNTSIALDLIFSLCRSKVEDILFAAGEALSFIWGGVPVTADMILQTNYSSLSQSSKYLTREIYLNSLSNVSIEGEPSNSRNVVREIIVKKLFEDLLYSSRKEERCAGTVWLLSLTMYCGHDPKIQQLLPEIQEAFSHLLGEQNELTQELASQGMSIVYELGDTSMKKELVNALVNTLTGTGKRKRAVKLMGETEVFQEGSIGESLNGGKLSTYKELCSLANEMGQPDLIYKFMDLANYQASLNSKRGAAFGFSKIAKLAGVALQPYLSFLVPRLVRYQYDPDKNVQDAMRHIWNSIVMDPKRTIDEYLDVILDDLLTQSGSRLWRSREASCLAIADVIQGRKFNQVSKHLRNIWTATFRAMDDIKETVRNAGDVLCSSASSLTVRLCDVSLTEASDALKTMDIVLPFLLIEGIVSKVSSVQKASIGIVTKLAKGAGISIRPHLTELVGCMLESLSSLEDQRLNYVELHADNVGIHSEKLENLRIAMAKDSSMWETLDICLNVVDKEALDLLVPRLAQLVRSGVGLNTRVGVANFIRLLVGKVNSDIRPFASMLLKLLFDAVVKEKSNVAKRAFAAACATILKFAGPSQAENLIKDTASLHSGDRNSQISCAVLLRSYLSFAADVVSGYNAITIPVTFVSRFEDEKMISVLFEELWEENSSSERVTLQLYLAETVSVLCDCLSSSSWSSKRKSAKAIRNACEILGESVSESHQSLLHCLLKELPGRYWEGKEAILYAVASICASCHETICKENPKTQNVILDYLIAACKKQVKLYREAAFSSLEEVITAFKNPDFFSDVFPLLLEVYNQDVTTKPENASNRSSITKIEEDQSESISAPLEKVLACLTSSINVARLEDIFAHRAGLLHIFLSSFSPRLNWIVKVSLFVSIRTTCLKLQLVLDKSDALSSEALPFIHEMFHLLTPKVVECIQLIKISQVHTAASDCLLELCKAYKSSSPAHGENGELKSALVNLRESEKSEQAKAFLQRSINILEDLEQ